MKPKAEDPFQLLCSKYSYDSAILIDDILPSHLDTTMPLENIHTRKTDHNIDSICNSYTISLSAKTNPSVQPISMTGTNENARKFMYNIRWKKRKI